jgi:hypothetical protein
VLFARQSWDHDKACSSAELAGDIRVNRKLEIPDEFDEKRLEFIDPVSCQDKLHDLKGNIRKCPA